MNGGRRFEEALVDAEETDCAGVPEELAHATGDKRQQNGVVVRCSRELARELGQETQSFQLSHGPPSPGIPPFQWRTRGFQVSRAPSTVGVDRFDRRVRADEVVGQAADQA
jgi:hypothetical protein